MVKSKTKPKHLVGYRYTPNQLPKVRQCHSTHKYKAKRKHILHSKKIKPYEEVGYIEARKHFIFNYLDFIYKYKKIKQTTDDLNKATIFSNLPSQNVLRQETFPKMKHFIIAIPIKRWKNTEDKRTLLNVLYPKECYPDLYNN